ncbi:O-antigen ligase family protein [Arthrobacter sp. MDT3-44]
MQSDLLLAAVAVVGVVAIVALPIVPVGKILLLIVVGRSIAELGAASGGTAISSGLAGLLGALAVVSAFLPRVTRLHPRLHAPIILIVTVLIYGSIVRYSSEGSFFPSAREAVTLGSIVAVFVLAFTFATSELDRALKYLLWCSMPAALISFGGYLASSPLMVSESGRMNGTFNHANTAGAFFGVATVIAVCLALNLKRPRLLWVAALAMACLVVTESIGAWIGVIAALLVFIVATSALNRWQKTALMLSSSVAALISINSLGLPDRFSEFVGANADAAIRQGVTTNSLDWRLVNWHLLLGAWEQRPWFGYGLGSTSSTLMPLGAPPHSLPVQLLVELGVVGCAVVAVVLLVVLRVIFAALSRNRWEAALLLAIATFVLVNGSESNLLNYTPAMYLIALACGVLGASIVVSKPRHLSATPERVWRRPWRGQVPLPAHSVRRSVPSILTAAPPAGHRDSYSGGAG